MKSCVSVILALVLVFIIFEVVTMNPRGSNSSSSSASQDSDPGFEQWMESKDKNCKDVAGGFYSSPC